MRRRMRLLHLIHWRRGKTMYGELLELGAKPNVAQSVAALSRRWWHNSMTALHHVQSIAYFDALGMRRRCSGHCRCRTPIPTWSSRSCGRSGTSRPRRRLGCADGSKASSIGPQSAKYRHGENPAGWRGHLQNLLANPNKIAPVTNFPALPWQEIVEFMPLLVAREGIAARAVQFAILTACRSGRCAAPHGQRSIWRQRCGPCQPSA